MNRRRLIGSMVIGMAVGASAVAIYRRAGTAAAGEVTQGGTETLILFAISFAISAALAYWAQPDGSDVQPNTDNNPNTVTTRGALVPLLYGRYEVGATVIQATGEESIPIESGGKDSQVIGYEYREAASHVLVVGPGNGLHYIKQAGEIIWEGNVTPDNTPSGSSFQASDGSTFLVYWGKTDDPVHENLAASMDYRGRIKGVMRIDWWKKEKGGTRVWRDLKYGITGLDCNTSEFSVPSRIGSGEDMAINPAYIIWQALTSIYPWGCGMPAENIDRDSLEALAQLFEDEQVGANALFAGDSTVGSILEALAHDFGIMYAQQGDLLTFKPLREPATAPPAFDADRVKGNPRPRQDRGQVLRNRTLITYKSKDHNYRDQPVQQDVNPRAAESGQYTELTDSLSTITVKAMADKMGARLAADIEFAAQESNVGLLRDGEDVLPGDAFSVPGVGSVRATETNHDVEGRSKQCKVLTRATNQRFVVVPGGLESTPEEMLAELPDLRVAVVEVPSPGDPVLAVARIRAHEQIEQARVWVSADGGDYVKLLDSAAASAGGDLLEALGTVAAWQSGTNYVLDDVRRPTDPSAGGGGLEWVVTTAGMSGVAEPTWSDDVGDTVNDGTVVWTARAVQDGPIFEPLNIDYRTVPNLQSDAVAWKNGSTLLLINGEVIFVERLTSIAEANHAASTAYAIGDAVVPSDQSTGLRYVATVAGNSAVTIPAKWPSRAGQTLVDGGVTWEARHFRQRLVNLRRARNGTSYEAHAIGDTAYIIRAAVVPLLSDARIQPSTNVCVKTQPTARSKVVELAAVTPICINVAP